jgi:hypothetical protein
MSLDRVEFIEGPRKRVFVQPRNISCNRTSPGKLPTITVEDDGVPFHGFHAEIHGPSAVVYDFTAPHKEGTPSVWVETTSRVTLVIVFSEN